MKKNIGKIFKILFITLLVTGVILLIIYVFYNRGQDLHTSDFADLKNCNAQRSVVKDSFLSVIKYDDAHCVDNNSNEDYQNVKKLFIKNGRGKISSIHKVDEGYILTWSEKILGIDYFNITSVSDSFSVIWNYSFKNIFKEYEYISFKQIDNYYYLVLRLYSDRYGYDPSEIFVFDKQGNIINSIKTTYHIDNSSDVDLEVGDHFVKICDKKNDFCQTVNTIVGGQSNSYSIWKTILPVEYYNRRSINIQYQDEQYKINTYHNENELFMYKYDKEENTKKINLYDFKKENVSEMNVASPYYFGGIKNQVIIKDDLIFIGYTMKTNHDYDNGVGVLVFDLDLNLLKNYSFFASDIIKKKDGKKECDDEANVSFLGLEYIEKELYIIGDIYGYSSCYNGTYFYRIKVNLDSDEDEIFFHNYEKGISPLKEDSFRNYYEIIRYSPFKIEKDNTSFAIVKSTEDRSYLTLYTFDENKNHKVSTDDDDVNQKEEDKEEKIEPQSIEEENSFEELTEEVKPEEIKTDKEIEKEESN